MVMLVSPSETENYYFRFHDVLVGPFSGEGTHFSSRIEVPSTLDKLVESRGIWHENNVEHCKLEGEFYFNPAAERATPNPTAQYPFSQNFALYNRLGTPLVYKCVAGQFQDQGIAWTFSSTTMTQKVIKLMEYDPVSGDISIWNVVVTSASPRRVYSCFIYRLKSWAARPSAADGCTYYYTTQQYGGTFALQPTDLFSGELTPEIIKAAVLSGTNHYGESAPTAAPGTWYRQTLTPIYSPSAVSAKLYVLLVRIILDDILFPVKGKHFGDLATDASQQVNANQVNMIAFLRDLRHPEELIPKLRNLLNIKTVAGNYLGFKYGVLPTIDDIQSIIGAFRRVAPYVDRNGFSTYSAGFTDSIKDGLYTYTLEQHLKLAIQDEDDQFQALIQKLESMGVLPTFENIWDLVPYSFVLDWLIDVGGLLERIDTRLRLARLNICYATMSTKQTQEGRFFLSKDSPYTGKVKWVHYRRWVADHCPVPPLSLSPTFQDFDHWLESSALLIQRAKK